MLLLLLPAPRLGDNVVAVAASAPCTRLRIFGNTILYKCKLAFSLHPTYCSLRICLTLSRLYIGGSSFRMSLLDTLSSKLCMVQSESIKLLPHWSIEYAIYSQIQLRQLTKGCSHS